ncbi:MAG: hypothetical protein IJV35_06075 [Neisseriaceae bacterium]|nr:hypothetical protein [Neisseriaceae bacterium]
MWRYIEFPAREAAAPAREVLSGCLKTKKRLYNDPFPIILTGADNDLHCYRCGWFYRQQYS